MLSNTQVLINRRFLLNFYCRFINSIRIRCIKYMLISSIKLINSMIVNDFIFYFENLHFIIFFSSEKDITHTHPPWVHTLFVPSKTKVLTSTNTCDFLRNWNFGKWLYVEIICIWLLLFIRFIIVWICLFLILLNWLCWRSHKLICLR